MLVAPADGIPMKARLPPIAPRQAERRSSKRSTKSAAVALTPSPCTQSILHPRHRLCMLPQSCSDSSLRAAPRPRPVSRPLRPPSPRALGQISPIVCTAASTTTVRATTTEATIPLTLVSRPISADPQIQPKRPTMCQNRWNPKCRLNSLATTGMMSLFRTPRSVNYCRSDGR